MTNGTENEVDKPAQGKGKDPSKPKGQSGTGIVFLTLGLPVLVGIVVYSIAEHHFGAYLSLSLVIAGASFAIGGLLGFLFGLPKPAGSTEETETAARTGALSPNSNLVQISDWFTKILIGATLVQFKELVNSIGNFATGTLAPALGDDDTAKAYAIALLVASFVTGFLVGYLFTRLVLQGRMSASDAEAFADRVAGKVADQVEPKVADKVADKIKKNVELDLVDKVAEQVEPGLVDKAAAQAVEKLSQ